ncbi:hypothetical protein PRUPE_3G091000 [Prunus persica]|uniref:Uncharacterized protein n=1 Tax=Prunus persica TaxID=3760 RepID=A0A251PXK7_PRUPE|nr:hypothetical protein PRUPE_3G091000 [Prunus persica]
MHRRSGVAIEEIKNEILQFIHRSEFCSVLSMLSLQNPMMSYCHHESLDMTRSSY